LISEKNNRLVIKIDVNKNIRSTDIVQVVAIDQRATPGEIIKAKQINER
jgi:hypothetical protein